MTTARTAPTWIALGVALSLVAPAHAAEITIYRCVDAKGHLTLRDSPCKKGEKQSLTEMQRPRDPPKRKVATTAASKPASKVTATADASAASMPRYIVMTPPKPMYECTTPDGTRYMSDNGQGNPRWMPLWALGYPVAEPRTSLGDNIGGPPARPMGTQPGPPSQSSSRFIYDPYGPGAWVRDECYPLPLEEACARLRDQRWDLGRQYNSALQSERRDIEVEQRGIDARLQADCGGV